MTKHIAIALDIENLKYVQSLVDSLITFDIYTPNPIARMHIADTTGKVLVIHVDDNSIELHDWRDFQTRYRGTYGSRKFSLVEPM